MQGWTFIFSKVASRRLTFLSAACLCCADAGKHCSACTSLQVLRVNSVVHFLTPRLHLCTYLSQYEWKSCVSIRLYTILSIQKYGKVFVLAVGKIFGNHDSGTICYALSWISLLNEMCEAKKQKTNKHPPPKKTQLNILTEGMNSFNPSPSS